jgi:enoyl-CoA hydratase/carnithine racemase
MTEVQPMADLEYCVADGVATILLNRPSARNAFTLEMIDAWAAALEAAQSDSDVAVIVLRGAGGAFCAGIDLDRIHAEFGTTPIEQKEYLRQRIQRIPRLVEQVDKPLIAAINGAATGAGLDMALMCDMRLAARSARLAETYIRLGLLPGDGGAYYLPRLVGYSRAFELLLTGAAIDAEEAQRIGLVNHVYDDEELIPRTYALARRIGEFPPTISALMKRTLRQSSSADLATALDLVSSHLGVVRATPESQAAMERARERFRRTDTATGAAP